MKRYWGFLIGLTVLLVLAGFLVRWITPEQFTWMIPLMALYFGAVTGVQHYAVVKSMYKSPRTFVKVFMGATVVALLLHLVVLTGYLFSHPTMAKQFTLIFCIGYLIFLVFETVALVKFINAEKKKRQANN